MRGSSWKLADNTIAEEGFRRHTFFMRPAQLFILLLFSCLIQPQAATADRNGAEIQSVYEGRNPDAFAQVQDRVVQLVKTSQLEVSVGLGLQQYREGFQYPFQIRFEDSPSPGFEHTLAYVRLGRTSGGFAQEMVIHLEELRAIADLRWLDVEKVFYHEMTHAVLNDTVGGDAARRLPTWLHEGLAQFISREGEDRFREAAGRFTQREIKATVFQLERPFAQLAYPQFYLAVRYLNDKHSINAIQGMVRYIMEGKSVEQALLESTGLSLERFYQNVNDYTRDAFLDRARI